MRPIFLSHLALLIVNIIYGLNYNIAKDLTPVHIGPYGFVLMRVLGAVLLIWMLGLLYPEKVDRKDWNRFFLCALTGVFFNQTLFFLGLSLTSPINASIIMISSPIFVVLFASWLLKEKITWNKSMGILFGVTGALILIFVRGKGNGVSNIWGDLWIFLNALSYAIYLVMVKPLMLKYHPVTVMKWVFLLAVPFIIPVGYQQMNAIEWHNFTTEMYAGVVFVIVATTFLAYLLSNYALRRVSPAVVGAYIYLQPVLATVISMIQLKDQPNIIKVCSALLIFIGVYLVSKPSTKTT